MYKVLIVDDEERIRTGLTTIIDWEAHGYVICGTAENGLVGIEKAKEVKPDLILVDICMPGIDGIQMIEFLQDEGFLCQFIILSGVKDFEYARRAIDLRAAAYLLKPVSKSELSKKVSELVILIKNGGDSEDYSCADPDDVVRQIKNYINVNYGNSLLLNIIAEELHYSAPYLGRLFKKKTGMSFHMYLEQLRMEKAKILLEEGHKVYLVSHMCGYKNVDYFTNKFKAYTGLTPTKYKG